MSKGIDIPIDALIADMNSRLWPGKLRQFVGRIYRSEFNGLVQPLYYSTVQGAEPIEVLKDDRKDAQCFVDVQPDGKMFADIIEAECRLCIMVNLRSIYPQSGRSEAIESVKSDVTELLMSSQFELIKTVSGVTAFADYKWSEDDRSDLQNFHLFRFDLKTTYTNTL